LMWTSAKYGGKSIFVDLGLVGLFGKISPKKNGISIV
jgi:hypothetical protein